MKNKNVKRDNVVNSKIIKEDIKKISSKDKSLVPKYFDDIKKKYKIEEKEITKDNPYYKYL